MFAKPVEGGWKDGNKGEEEAASYRKAGMAMSGVDTGYTCYPPEERPPLPVGVGGSHPPTSVLLKLPGLNGRGTGGQFIGGTTPANCLYCGETGQTDLLVFAGANIPRVGTQHF